MLVTADKGLDLGSCLPWVVAAAVEGPAAGGMLALTLSWLLDPVLYVWPPPTHPHIHYGNSDGSGLPEGIVNLCSYSHRTQSKEQHVHEQMDGFFTH